MLVFALGNNKSLHAKAHSSQRTYAAALRVPHSSPHKVRVSERGDSKSCFCEVSSASACSSCQVQSSKEPQKLHFVACKFTYCMFLACDQWREGIPNANTIHFSGMCFVLPLVYWCSSLYHARLTWRKGHLPNKRQRASCRKLTGVGGKPTGDYLKLPFKRRDGWQLSCQTIFSAARRCTAFVCQHACKKHRPGSVPQGADYIQLCKSVSCFGSGAVSSNHVSFQYPLLRMRSGQSEPPL